MYYNKLEHNKTLPVFEEEVFVPGSTDLNADYKPLRNSLYELHLANWLEHFPLESFLIVNGDVFRGNPLSMVRFLPRKIPYVNNISRRELPIFRKNVNGTKISFTAATGGGVFGNSASHSTGTAGVQREERILLFPKGTGREYAMSGEQQGPAAPESEAEGPGAGETQATATQRGLLQTNPATIHVVILI